MLAVAGMRAFVDSLVQGTARATDVLDGTLPSTGTIVSQRGN